jgi:hypothetical protein
MPAKATTRRKPLPILATGADGAMTPAQAAELKQLAVAAYEHDAFSRRLTRSDAARRIDMLKAKLTLLDEPPHTL